MIGDAFSLLRTRWDFFSDLLLEHLQISLISVAIAIVIGLAAGIVISEYQKSSSRCSAS
jgi:ABC-type proline/glycine betaine transport system permease subunit